MLALFIGSSTLLIWYWADVMNGSALNGQTKKQGLLAKKESENKVSSYKLLFFTAKKYSRRR